MGANPLEYLDFGGALRGGFQLGLQVQHQRDQRKVAEIAQADRAMRLEIERQQENRMREHYRQMDDARRAMEQEKAETQKASVAFIMDSASPENPGKTDLERTAWAIQRNPKAHQAQFGVAGLMDNDPEEKEPIVKLKDGRELIRSGWDVLPPPQAEEEVPETKFNSQGIPFIRNDKGKWVQPTGAQKISEAYLAEQNKKKSLEASLKSLKAQQAKGVEKVGTYGFRRPILEAINDKEEQLLEITRKNQPKSRGKTSPPPGSPPPPAATNAPKQKITREKAKEFWDKALSQGYPSNLTKEQQRAYVQQAAQKMAEDGGYEF